jgi:putative oxidoreductase
MSALAALRLRVEPWLERLTRAQWLPLLLMRLFIGYFFFETGLGKVGNLDAMAERFAGWGIPWPAFNAALSGYTELIGGALIVLGLATRLAAIPLAINMLVATATVKLKGVESLDDFVELDEPLYALVFVWLVFSGAGRISLDHLIRRRLGPHRP